MIRTITSTSFSSLRVATISASPQDTISFCLHYFFRVRGGGFLVFLLAFPSLMTLTPQTKQLTWQLSQLTNMSILIIHLMTGEMTTDGSMSSVDLLWVEHRQVSVGWSSYIPILNVTSWSCFKSLSIGINSDLVSDIFKCLSSLNSLRSQYSYLHWWSKFPLGKSWRNNLECTLVVVVKSFLLRTWPFLPILGPGSKIWLRSVKWQGSGFLLEWIPSASW